jgi:molybdenum cofactor cytidylyltransferase
MFPELAAIVPAAGLSSRSSGFKPLLELGGRTLLYRAVDLFQRAGVEHVVVVTGHQAERVAGAAVALDALPVFNRDFRAGMFSSVRAGVRALPQGCAGFFVLPVDVPLVRPATVRALARSFGEADGEALVPAYHGRPGHPPLIPATFIPAILASNGQGGLRVLLHARGVRHLAVSDQGVLLDVDTDADFARLAEIHGSLPPPA